MTRDTPLGSKCGALQHWELSARQSNVVNDKQPENR
jgi:hypothetical protein